MQFASSWQVTRCVSVSGHLLTSLTSDDHRLHDETEEFIQHQMKVKDQWLQTGGWQGDDAELQLMFQLVLRNLLLPNAQRECSPSLQGMTKGKETLQVVILTKKGILLQKEWWIRINYNVFGVDISPVCVQMTPPWPPG